MTDQHLSEEMLRQFAINRETINREEKEHLLACPQCREQFEIFQMVQAEIEWLPRPSLPPDYQDRIIAVIGKTEPKSKQFSVPVLIYLLAIALVTAFVVLLFKRKLEELLAKFQPYVLLLLAVAVLCILCGLMTDQYHEYRKKIKLIQSAT